MKEAMAMACRSLYACARQVGLYDEMRLITLFVWRDVKLGEGGMAEKGTGKNGK